MAATFSNLEASTRSFIHDTLVTVTVKDCKQQYLVSNALLCQNSRYFSRILDEQSQHDETEPFLALDCNEQTFKMLMFYAAHRSFPICSNEDAAEFSSLLIQLWLFAGQVESYDMQNRTMNHLLYIHTHKVALAASAVDQAFVNADADSELCEAIIFLTVVAWCRKGTSAYSPADMDSMSQWEGFFFKFTEIARQISYFTAEGAVDSNHVLWDLGRYMVDVGEGES